MAYNSMNAMLMGGIVPSQISKEVVLEYIYKEFKRPRKLTYNDIVSEGNSWAEIIRGFGMDDTDIDKLATVIANFLRISAQYGLIGGPMALLRLRTARVDLIELGRPLVDIAIRVMKDMRRSDSNRMSSLRTQFIREQSVPKALRLMQFAPGFGFYDDELVPLPKSLQTRLKKYQNPAKAGAAIRMALKRRKNYPQLTALERFDTRAYDYMPTPVRGLARDFAPYRPQLSQEQLRKLQDRTAKAQQTLAASNQAYYDSLDPELRDYI